MDNNIIINSCLSLHANDCLYDNVDGNNKIIDDDYIGDNNKIIDDDIDDNDIDDNVYVNNIKYNMNNIDWTDIIDDHSVIYEKIPQIYMYIHNEKRNSNTDDIELIKQTKNMMTKIDIDIDIDIDDQNIPNIEKLEDIELLEKSSMLARNIKYQITKKFINEYNNNKIIDWLYKSLTWLKNVIELLIQRNYKKQLGNLRIIDSIKNNNNNSIIRNSYKFCEFGHQCKFNYSEYLQCYSQHYVYDLVYVDINEIIKYIENSKNKTKYDININEIKTSINTITYVINHIYDELFNLKLHNYDKFVGYNKRIYKFKLHSKNRQKKH